MHTVALIADTHGLLAARVCQILTAAKVTHILHAGDVGPGAKTGKKHRLDARSLLAHLSEVSEVDAVRGNTDDGKGCDLPATLTYNAGAIRFVVHHGDKNGDMNVPQPHYQHDDAVLAALRPAGGWRKTGDIIVSGHSHEPRFVRHPSGVCFLNPGTAGGRTETKRFGKTYPQQVAIVRCSDTAFQVSAIDLETGKAREWEPSPSPATEEEATQAETGVVTAAASRKRARQPVGGGASADASAAASTCSTPGGEVEEDMLLGTLTGCFLKHARGAPMTRMERLEVEACLGIAGDVHANRRSPRQVLLAASCRLTPGQPPASVGTSLSLPPGALRENLHLSLLPGRSAELWPVRSGRVLSIGTGGAALRISFACEPCAKGAEAAGANFADLSRGWQRHAQRGLLATALRSGVLREGDEVWLLAGEKYAPLSSEHPARVRQILGKLPRGRVLPWNELAQLAGAPTGFGMRGMPGLLKKAVEEGAPSWRVVDSTGRGIPQHLPQQRQTLEEEGIEMSADRHVKEQQSVLWEPSHEELYWDLPHRS